jgi:hypothetical protein
MNKKRVEIRITSALYNIIVDVCRKRNISINRFILRALIEKLIRDRDIKELK